MPRKPGPTAATAPILAKLAPPRARRVLARPRLHEQLDALAAEAPGLWLAAEPGAGKTLLAATWSATRPGDTVFYRVDAGDDDPGVLSSYLALALPQRAARRAAARAERVVWGEMWADRLELFWRAFFRDFYGRLRAGSVLVFDDAQAAAGPAFETALRVAIEEAPPGCNVLVLSHIDPPTLWLDLVSGGRLAIVDGELLVFTLDEARELVGSQCQDEALESAYAASGGWAAGLVLLGRTGGGSQSAPGAMHEELLGYLASRFIEPLPAQQRSLLATLSWLPQFGAEACTEFSEDPDAVRWIESLQRRHLFIARLATRPPMWRLHDLFRAALRVEFERTADADWRKTTLERIARFALKWGYLEVAVDAFLRAGDAAAALSACVGQLSGLLHARREGEFLRAAQLLPALLAETDPALQEALGRALARRAAPTALGHFERAFVGYEARGEDERALVVCATALGAMISGWAVFAGRAAWQERMGRLMTLDLRACRATERLRIGFVWLRANEVSFSIAVDDRHAREIVTAIVDTLSRGTAVSEADAVIEADDAIEANDAIEATVALIEFASRGGDRDLLERAVDLSLPWLGHPELSAGALAGWYIALAAVAPRMPVHRPGVLEGDAVRLFERAAEIARANAIDALAYAALSYLVASMFSRGDAVAAEKYLQGLREVTDPRLPTQLAGLLQFEARQLLLAGSPDQALLASNRALEAAQAGEFPPGERWIFELQRTQVLIALGREDEARAYALEKAAPFHAMRRDFLEILADLATLAQQLRLGRPPDAALLERVLARSREHNWWAFANHLPRLAAQLCAEALARGIEIDFAREAIARRTLAAPDGAPGAWPWPVRVKALGDFEVSVGDQPLPAGPRGNRKPLDLVRLLVGQVARAVDVSVLASALWPDADGDAARAAFDTTLHRLRKLLGRDDVLVLREGQLGFDRQLVWADTWSFDALVARIDSPALASLDGDQVTALTNALCGLYRGDFSGGGQHESWAVSIADRCRSQFLRALQRAGQRLEALQRWDDAERLYRLALEHDNLAEDLYRCLMRCLLRQNRPAEAVQAFRRCREMLSILVGRKPGAATEALMQEAMSRTG